MSEQQDKPTKAEARLTELAIGSWQAGYGRGHNDTVESCYNPGWEDDPEAAEEWLCETQGRPVGPQTADTEE